MTTDKLRIDVVSDVVCPWCYIGKKNLEKAASQVDGVELDIHWRPYQLDATIPAGGMDRKQYMLAKFGSEERLKTIHARVEEAGRAAGIEFNFGAIRVAANTLDAHRLIRWAGGVDAATQGAVVSRLFELNFLEGADIGDRYVLSAVAEGAGMDGAVVRELLSGDRDSEAVRKEIASAQQMGVTGVPCFILDGRYAVMGAQPADVLAQAIRQAASEQPAAAE